ncbi:MAG: tyrosine-type recombinase/integrase [Cyclobacteriaceae bacterium]
MKEINKRLKNIELWLDNMSDKNKETYSLLIKADIKAIKEQLLIHSCFTNLTDQVVDLRVIQKLAGHSSSKTTEIYTRVSTRLLKQINLPI